MLSAAGDPDFDWPVLVEEDTLWRVVHASYPDGEDEIDSIVAVKDLNPYSALSA